MVTRRNFGPTPFDRASEAEAMAAKMAPAVVRVRLLGSLAHGASTEAECDRLLEKRDRVIASLRALQGRFESLCRSANLSPSKTLRRAVAAL